MFVVFFSFFFHFFFDFPSMSTEHPLLTPSSGAGHDYGTYSFQQTLTSIDVFVPLAHAVKSRDVDVKISAGSLRVGLKNAPPILTGPLHDKVKPDDSTWTLVDGTVIHIFLEKFDQRKWWSCVVQGEPELDTKQIVPENSKLSDLDGDMRQTVEKMMFDQRQKAAGLPTSAESEKFKIFEQFKKTHPELDFSKAKMNFGGDDAASAFAAGMKE